MSEKIPSRRGRSDVQVGYVNFPVDRIPSTGEGGVLVRLVVLDTAGDKEYMHRYPPCCGGYVSFTRDECFLGDDLLGVSREGSTQYGEAEVRFRACELRYFPDIDNEESPGQYTSREFLAVLLLGATGWSSSDWACTYNDLTEDGKALYDSIRALYPGCELRLLTFIDT